MSDNIAEHVAGKADTSLTEPARGSAPALRPIGELGDTSVLVEQTEALKRELALKEVEVRELRDQLRAIHNSEACNCGGQAMF